MAKYFSYVVLNLCVIFLNSCQAKLCLYEEKCMCHIDEYSYISLATIVSPDKKFFRDTYENISYFFTGCEDATFNSKDYNLIGNKTNLTGSLIKCSTVVVNNTITDYNCSIIGYAKDIKYDLVPNTLYEYQIVYSNSTSVSKSLPSIRLACDNINRTDLKIISSDTDALILYSPVVCIHHNPHYSLSTGSIFCVIFFTISLIYFIGGGCIMYFLRGARGAEMIPNFDFWASIPGLVNDGLIFVFSGCRPFSVSTAETYDRI
ncbi:hypothetical protein ABEB36_008883 [Hypothenemus hampei]|uniref:Cation-dependent mannose-6-phosphate receptor n=1 Tax=Hypothenemus hampei TaxID=57062 RepID=A0ABD1END9_HYPHA